MSRRSNPRARVGRGLRTSDSFLTSLTFQSTRPRGALQYVYLQYGDTSSVSIQRWRGPDARFESVTSRLLRTTPNRETYGGT